MNFMQYDESSVWEIFILICSVPHPSHHEEALAATLARRCEERGFLTFRDAGGNLVVQVPGSGRQAGKVPVILQAHLDMVAQKDSGTIHDFLQDPVRVRELPDAPGWLGAAGTTLGADNGIGVAMALALLEEHKDEYGELYCLFTTGEEDGMGGARAAGEGLPERAFLVNVDGETEGELTTGCAGSIRMLGRIEAAVTPVPEGFINLKVALSGLAGGHSGMDIGSGRANAALTLVRLLASGIEKSGLDVRLVNLGGGTAANAIPREAEAVLALDGGDKAAFLSWIEAEAGVAARCMVAQDSGFSVVVREGGQFRVGMDARATREALRLLSSLPFGVLAMETGIAGAVRTSVNLGRLGCEIRDGSCRIEALLMSRSSVEGDLDGLAVRIRSLFAGTEAGSGIRTGFEELARSPAWKPDFDSPLLATAKEVYLKLAGSEVMVGTTHGGLECGHFASRFPGWDMVSMGPTIRYPHSPSERVEIGSVGRSYRYLEALVAALAS